MLNDDDIRKRLERYPEPPEVAEIRRNIQESFKRLEFQEGPHKYYVHEDDGSVDELPSVSATIEKWEQYVDWEAKKEKKALELGMTVEQVSRMWREKNIVSTSNGTLTHAFGEAYMHYFQGRHDLMADFVRKMQYEDGWLIPYSPKQNAAMQYYQDIYDVFMDDNKPVKLWPVMPESQIYIFKDNNLGLTYRYSGTFDILHAFQAKNGKWKLTIHDFKGLPLDTPILTTDGFKTMENLKCGDSVYDKDGNSCKITGVSEIHNNPCMRITFDDNYSIVADEEHRWLVYFTKRNGVIEEKVMTTKELYDHLLKYNGKKRSTYNLPKIAINKPLNTKKDDSIEIDPYVFGVWLGDGHSACGYVTNMYDEIFNEIERRGYHVGRNVNDGVHCGKAKTRCVFGLASQLRKYNLINNKHMPDEFINGMTYEMRLDILRGLMDTDGYYNRIRKRFVLSTTRINQVHFTVRILTSLGIKPTVIKAKGQCNNCIKKRAFDRWDIVFSTNINPFLIRNINFTDQARNEHVFRNISKIEYCDTVPTKCIQVDSPSHTYLAGEMLLVTHNTNHSLTNDFVMSKKQMMKEPFDDMLDHAISHYTIQLSLYQLGLEQLGYEIADRKLIWLKDDGTYEKVPVPDVTDRLKSVL